MNDRYYRPSETNSAMSCDVSCNSDHVRPVSLLMVQDDKTLVTKTEYIDDNSMLDNASEKGIKQETPRTKTEYGFGEGGKDFVFSNTEDHCEAESEIKSGEMISSKFKDLPPNGNSNTKERFYFTKHVASEVREEENAIELTFDCGFSTVKEESVTSDINQMSDHYIIVNAEATQQFEEIIRTEPTLLDDFMITEPIEQNIHSDKIKIERVELSNIIKTEGCDYSMHVGPYTTNNMAEGDNSMAVKTELDDSETTVKTKIVDSEKMVKTEVDDREIVVETEVGDSEIVVKTEIDDSEIVVETEVGDSEIVVETEVGDIEIVVKTEIDDSEIMVETEIDEPCMFEYPETATDEVKGQLYFDDIENSLHISHNRGIDKGTPAMDRPLEHKRRLKVSTKMKAFVSDFVPYISDKKRNTNYKTRNFVNVKGACQTEKCEREIIRLSSQTPVVDRRSTHKRRIGSTNMKDCDSDYVPYESGNKIKKQH